jgi:hypothetical protein
VGLLHIWYEMNAAFGLRADFFAFGLAALFRAVFVAFFAAVFFTAFFTLFFALFLAIGSPLESSPVNGA